MVALIKLFGITIIIFGAVYFTKPAVMPRIMSFWLKGRRLYVGAVLNFIAAFIFLFGAAQCQIPWIIITFGIIGVLKGAVIFGFGQKKFETFYNKFTRASRGILRFMACIILVIGIILIYAA